MAKQQTYCLVKVPHDMIFPAEIAMELFPLLCAGEPVTYDWSNKTYSRTKIDGYDNGCNIKQFTIAQYAELALNSDAE